MPQRFLRPGITTSKRFNRSGWMNQSFYTRLLTLVDDFGRYDADPELLRSHAFPFGDPKGKAIPVAQIVGLCRQLNDSGMVLFYETSDGRQILQLLRWNEKARAERSKYEPFTDSCKQMFTDENICSPPSSSSSSSPLHPRHSSNGSDEPSRAPSLKFQNGLTDSEWLARLTQDKAYEGIDVMREHGKLINWCNTNQKSPTRRRFINWLNRAERPMAGKVQPRFTNEFDRKKRRDQVQSRINEIVKADYPESTTDEYKQLREELKQLA